MLLDTDVSHFTIRSHLWRETNQDFKSDLASLLKTDLAKAECFCDEYFDKFYLIHQLGHIILHLFDPEQAQKPARTEYLANLFAVKYFEYKKEYDYLDRLSDCLAGLASSYRALFDFHVDKLNGLHDKYKKEIITLAAWHINALRAARRSKESLAAVLSHMSGRALTSLNNGVLPRKGLRGRALLQECKSTIFELNNVMPEISVEYCQDLSIANFDVEITLPPSEAECV